MNKVGLSRNAQEFYRKADRPLARKLARCFQHLERDARGHPNVKPLTVKLAGHYRFRVGDYRVL